MTIDNICEKFNNWLEYNPKIKSFYETYVVEKAIPHGYPFSLITTTACAIFFKCSTTPAAALFATVNYAVLTTSVELLRHNSYKTPWTVCVLITTSGIISGAALSVLLGERPSNIYCVALTAAGLVGHLFRFQYSQNE